MWKLKDILLFILITSVISVFLYYFTFTSFSWENWPFVLMNIIFFSLFLLLTQFRKKISRLPNSAYLAFIVALFAEMYGFPLTMYIFMGFLGNSNVYSLEFLLTGIMGQEQFYNVFHYYIFPASKVIMGIGMLLVIYGWLQIYRAKGQLVTTGLYSRIRHPQYLGFLIITLGLNVQWLTIITLLLWPVLAFLYYRLAKREEKDEEEQFGEEYRKYKRTVPMFLPRIRRKNPDS